MRKSDYAEGKTLRERERLGQIAAIFSRHGLRSMAAWLGIGVDREGELEDARPEALVAVIRDLGPVAVKFGQILAMRSDLLGPEWIRALATLQDRVPSLPFEQIRPLVEDTLGNSLDDCFASFDPEPIAAASIAQVHTATLLSGERVIVKVRRPGIERTVDADLRLLRRLARTLEQRLPEIARLKPDELLRYFAESLEREMDLSAEGRASDSIGAYLADQQVRTARFEWELTGHNVNVQERMEAIPATDLATARERGIDLTVVSRRYARAVLRMIVFNGQFHADPHPGNVLIYPDGTIAFIDFGAVGTLLPRRREELVRLGLAIAAEDPAGVVDVLIIWAGDPQVDRTRLEFEVASLIDEFRNIVLEQIDLTRIFAQVFGLLRDFRLALPPDLALVLRTLLTAEGFVRRIDPGFDIGSELAPIARELIAQRTSPARLAQEGRKLLAAFGRATLSAPDLLGQVEKLARTGSIPITLDESSLQRLEPRATPMALSDLPLISASLIVAAAILTDGHPKTAVLSLAAAVALFLARTLKMMR